MTTPNPVSEDLFACIMAGGSGERFWPLSRNEKPKHLLKLFSDKTLLEETISRLDGVVPSSGIFILTNQLQAESIVRALMGSTLPRIWLEPCKRDTAPAAALASALVARSNPEGIIALLPSDALIKNIPEFRNQLRDAYDLARESNALVTLSISPTHPATSFGYLELGENLGKGKSGSCRRKVTRFVEKPTLEKAEDYLRSGNYGWNGGIFVWKVSAFREELKRLHPELSAFVDQIVEAKDLEKTIQNVFPKLSKISVDYAIMEKASNVVAVESKFDWDDVGSWTALPRHFDPDASGNTIKGAVITHNSSSNIVISENRLVTLCGVKDLVVVETADAILVAHKDAVQDIKKLQPNLPPEVL